MDLTEMVGNFYCDTETGITEKVLEVTTNSVLVTRTKLTEKGIDCTNWFSINDFNKKFIVLHEVVQNINESTKI